MISHAFSSVWHRFRPLLLMCFVAAPVTAADSAPAPLPLPPGFKARYAATKNLEWEYSRILRDEGRVLVGRLIPPPDVQVASRTPLLQDGSFSTAVYPGRTLIFFAHGHDALIVEEGEEVLPSLLDVGEQRFVATPPERLRTVSGMVGVNGPAPAADLRLQVELGIMNLAYLYSDHGHRGGLVNATVQVESVPPGGQFAFKRLSPIPYRLKLSAPGYISRVIELDPEATGDIPLGEVLLNPAPVLHFTYAAQLDLETGTDLEIIRTSTQTIVCDGDARFDYTEARDQHRNRLYLRLKPRPEGGVEASFWAMPSEFHDLGSGVLADFLTNRDWTGSLAHPPALDSQAGWRQVLRRGHVYFFRNQSRGTNCLFAVE